MQFKFYSDDLRFDPRDCEATEVVVRYWTDPTVRYAAEEVDASNYQYYDIVAERVLFRNLIGIKEQAPAMVLAAHPLGGSGPRLWELMASEIKIGVALVPLTPPLENDVEPVLARLYCVEGLARRQVLGVTDGIDDIGVLDCSWFLVGHQGVTNSVSGRSWLLAAHLAKYAADKNDVVVKMNLATRFIVTGNVKSGIICQVEEGKKAALSKIIEYRNLKWIMSKENNMNIQSWKVEKPATLEEACALIETMQSTATKSFFRFLRKGDLRGIKEQYKIGASIFATEENTGLMPIEIVSQCLEQALRKWPSWSKEQEESEHTTEEVRVKNDNGKIVENYREVLAWLLSMNADCAGMYYLLARGGFAEAVKGCLELYPINARSGDGMTAMDMALNAEDLDAAALLHDVGCKCNPSLKGYKGLQGCLSTFADAIASLSEKARKKIINAINYGGLSPEMMIKMKDISDPRGAGWSTLFGVSIFYADYEIAEACLNNGADANGEIAEKEEMNDGLGCEWEETYRHGRPLDLILKRNWQNNDKDLARKERFVALLKKFGAKED